MIRPEAAWECLEAQITPLPHERVPRHGAAGRVLVEDLRATVDVPPHDVSAMDGFVLSGSVEPEQPIPVRGAIAAGDSPGAQLESGTALRIMTGAPIPLGGDRVVPVELTRSTATQVTVSGEVVRGAHIRRQGEIVIAGRPILRSGAMLTPGAMSVLATHGFDTVAVHRLPRIASVATGNEIVPPGAHPGPGQLRDSHTDFLMAACQSLGLHVEHLGIVADDPDLIERKIKIGLGADVLLISGGVSMGEFDYVEQALSRLGCRTLFDAVAIQPGKPLVACRHAGGFVIGLPGNPASVMVGFWLFVRPLLRRMLGFADSYWHGALQGDLAGPLPAARDRDRFLAAEVDFVDGRLLVTPHPPQGSHDLQAYSCGTALVRVPAGSAAAEAGSVCQVLPFANWPARRRDPTP